MLDEYKSLPFIAGICILFLIPITIGSLAYYSFAEGGERSPNIGKSGSASNSSTELGEEGDFKVVPIPASNSRGSGEAIDSGGGIPIGKYSNPPTDVPLGGSGISTSNRGVNNFESSVDRNRSIQESNSNSTPDYTAPSSSNNYNATPDNSLAAPLEDDSYLELPESNNSEPVPVSPAAEPLFQQ